MNRFLPAELFRRFLPACALAAAPFPLRAQNAVEPLEPFVVTATRTARPLDELGSATDVVSAADLARRQISSLRGALGLVPGAPTFGLGAPGGSTSLFLRGANSNQTLFLVDGIRLNDPNTDYAVLLGGGCVSACDSLEISRGPQSTLYGGEAVGGVVSLRALRGEGPVSGSLALEAGSFGTVQAAAAAQGAEGRWAYNASLIGGHTDNDRSNNAFDSLNATVRLDRDLSASVKAGGTLRHFSGDYGSPGDRFAQDPDNTEREGNTVATAFVEVSPAKDWEGKLTLGGQNRRFVSENPRAGRATQITVVKNRRAVLDAQATYSGWERHRLTAGSTAEANHTRNTGFGNINKKQTLLAVFAQDEFSPVDDLFLTAGLRHDDFDTFGQATTGRATAAWKARPDRLKLRASYATAFRSPGFLDLYGQSAFYVGNPNLRPENARGWDAGADLYLPGKAGTLSATWFETRVRDLIVFDFARSPSTMANVERARTRGLELSTQVRVAGFELRAAYTYLEAENLTQSKRLLRRPRHAFGGDLWRDWGKGFSAGAGLGLVGGREDIDARRFVQIDGEDYAVVRLYAAWRVNRSLTLKARMENLLDETYEEVNGYPALPLGAFAGIEWRF